MKTHICVPVTTYHIQCVTCSKWWQADKPVADAQEVHHCPYCGEKAKIAELEPKAFINFDLKSISFDL